MKIKVSIALEESLVARVDRVADAIGANRSGLVQKLIEREIEQAELLAGLYGGDALRLVQEQGVDLADIVEKMRQPDVAKRRKGARRENK